MEEKCLNKDEEYSLKISNFLAMTQTTNEDEALEYLLKSDWNEIEAVNLYLAETRESNFDPNEVLIYKENNQNSEETINFIDGPKYQPINSQPKVNPIINNKDIQQIPNNTNNTVTKSWISSFCSSISKVLNIVWKTKKELPQEREEKLFSSMPSRIRSFEFFISILHKSIGLLIIYDESNLLYLSDIINQINLNFEISNMLKNRFSVHLVLCSSPEGQMIKTLLNTNFKEPGFFYLHNSVMTSDFSQTRIIYSTQGDRTINELKTDLDTAINLVHRSKARPQSSITKLIEQQNSQMKQLEEEAKLQEQLAIERELKKEREKEEKEKENKRKAEEAKMKIVDEPIEGDPNSTIICFRYPDGEKRIERRFLKSHTIQHLYDFVSSLGNEIYTEPENRHFSLIQTFPFKLFNQMDKILEEEGLFPNAVLQIKEDE